MPLRKPDSSNTKKLFNARELVRRFTFTGRKQKKRLDEFEVVSRVVDWINQYGVDKNMYSYQFGVGDTKIERLTRKLIESPEAALEELKLHSPQNVATAFKRYLIDPRVQAKLMPADMARNLLEIACIFIN
jgi:hypothetical protein